MKPEQVVVTGTFDELQARQIRFLEVAAESGPLTVLLWSDELAERLEGRRPKFPEAERRYCLEALRFVHAVRLVNEQSGPHVLPETPGFKPTLWVVPRAQHHDDRLRFCLPRKIGYRAPSEKSLNEFPGHETVATGAPGGRKKVVVTGCFDWFHSGHVRFCEEVSRIGDLYVVVGSDANVRLLKGEGHPLFPQAQRRYVIGAIRHVKEAVISTGSGWLDADPEIRRLKPDIFAVNEDGDKGGKREYCEKLGIEYLILKRTPAPGLTGRTSTSLRGF